MSWPLFSWFVVGAIAERAEVVNVRTEVVNVRALPISCLVAIRSDNSSPMILIMTSWFEPRNANSETPKSNYYFSNSCFAFTLYWASGELQMVGGSRMRLSAPHRLLRQSCGRLHIIGLSSARLFPHAYPMDDAVVGIVYACGVDGVEVDLGGAIRLVAHALADDGDGEVHIARNACP